jgi:sugar/nucleoside kinase (ribokinase family)
MPGALQVAARHGTKVVLTAGDAGLVQRKRSCLWAALAAGVDVLFCNRGEAAALLGAGADAAAEECALGLGPHCDVVVVTDGASGSYISALGALQVGASGRTDALASRDRAPVGRASLRWACCGLACGQLADRLSCPRKL